METFFRLTYHLTAAEREAVLSLLTAADREFVPPLSARTGTTQQALSPSDTVPQGIAAYFTQLSAQAFVLAYCGERISGFLSFIPDYRLTAGGLDLCCDYVSTVIVSPAFRRQGITSGMYDTLFRTLPDHTVATRTWSQNTAHLRILHRLGFRLALTLENDRGKGIDTVYYVKEGSV